MDKETPRSVDAENGVEEVGNSHELCVEYTGTSTPAPVKQASSITSEVFLKTIFADKTEDEHICVSRSVVIKDGSLSL